MFHKPLNVMFKLIYNLKAKHSHAVKGALNPNTKTCRRTFWDKVVSSYLILHSLKQDFSE